MNAATEGVGQRFKGLDTWSTQDVLEALWTGQSRAVAACLSALPTLAAAVEEALARLEGGGTLIYVGAGTSAVLAALDGLELGPTFGWPRDRLRLVLAGISDLTVGFDGTVEDDPDEGARRLAATGCGPRDVVIAVSAGGRSAFVVEALAEAARRGALTIAVACTTTAPLFDPARHRVAVVTGDEVVAGSTRLGAATAQKAILNLFSTTLMVRLGATYDNLMVNVRIDNVKLRQRAADMLVRITGAAEDAALAALDRAAGDIKTAALLLAGHTPEGAAAALTQSGGRLRAALSAATS
ncbi:N-acetylmuramic acid 6-phosphate etherase [Nitrospirillum amazonense]|uniref:N-acetylmuramic acid 6-phosphate etherase n=1 Tax=Nitrospirillum amazonense TaxID=28077 RepID=A0A560JAB7_9PROT|nr:N-acetylmuramic acid 6-phosphate etherase [Nitrospirillum amazonense]MDG3440784.1 N-acetylmuramic acid 6-phosphate etherase [Nitrospirillum amazonense]TWB66274.1 N-acetylmuramic acid 6-phosphate etherase [Nitrospirillum amazonense]